MNVNLWFARDIHKEIVSIHNARNGNEYVCPICNSKVIPKALESAKVTPHFAHVDVENCNSESMLHWWFKHKFIVKGDTFTIVTDKEINYTCESYNIEYSYQLESGTYRPDLVVTTTCGNEIIFEMANTNKKMVKDYIDRWIELDKIIVEVDIKSLVGDEKKFNALYFNGKCFNFNRRDGGYYNTIGKLKEEMIEDKNYNTEIIKKIDWFWEDVLNYNNGKVDIGYMTDLIQEIFKINYSTEVLIKNILKNGHCSKLYKDYVKYISLDEQVLYLSRNGDGHLINSIALLESIFKDIDSKLSVEIGRINVHKYESYYHGSRKHRYKQRIKETNFNLFIKLKYENTNISRLNLTNRVARDVENIEFLKRNLINEISKGKKLQCKDCTSTFNVNNEDFKFYLHKNFKLPKRCKSCRQKRKQLT